MHDQGWKIQKYVFLKPTNLRSQILFFRFLFFVQFNPDHIEFHIVIVIVEFCCNL